MNENYVAEGWAKIKSEIAGDPSIYSFDETHNHLVSDDYYKKLFGRAKNRTLMKENPILYRSIYYYTSELKQLFDEQGSYKGNYSFSKRIRFIVEHKCDSSKLKCVCGAAYTWNTYCRHCPEYHRTWTGRTHLIETKRKQRVSTIKYLTGCVGKVVPRYNANSIPIIEAYGKQHGYNFQHAENGGEFYIKELGYWVDGYDAEKNVVIEIDEHHHFNGDRLKKSDRIRQSEIEKLLRCKFVRIRV